MKWYWSLALIAFAVLGVIAVWVGGLNQDEGWYLYAANLVAEGKLPYRDFSFTQGPVLPIVYSVFSPVWRSGGLLAARIFNLSLGIVGIVFACALARRLAPPERKMTAPLVTFFLLAVNLYHLYYLAIPKTYALAGLFVIIGFYLLSFTRSYMSVGAAICFVLAAWTRFSLGLILPVVMLWTFFRANRYRNTWAWLFLGAVIGMLPFVAVIGEQGFYVAMKYHSARTGSDLIWTIGSVSRLVRWYLPIFIMLGLGDFRSGRMLFAAFSAVALLQLAAPFPYDDYQVPIMALLAIFAAINVRGSRVGLLALGLSFATCFGSPLLQEWMTNGQDRFWSNAKEKTELAQLRDVARRIEQLDPGGSMLLTQDLYLAIETNRRVPEGLEMGPFAMLSDEEWKTLLIEAPNYCRIAALSGYTFAIEPPACSERTIAKQLEYWNLLERSYKSVFKEEYFGQNATPLLVLERKEAE